MSYLKKRKNKFNNRKSKSNNRCNVGNKSNKFKEIDTPHLFRGTFENGIIRPYIPDFMNKQEEKMDIIDKILDFAEEHPVLTPIIVSVISSFISSMLIILLKIW